MVVTGGTGYLGNAMVKGLLDFGGTVIAADISDRTDMNDVSLNKYKFIKCDVSSNDSVKNMLKETKNLFGKVDVLINCAYYYKRSLLEEMTDSIWQYGMDGSIGNTFRCTKYALPYFKENNGGIIINIASMYGMVSPDPHIYESKSVHNPPDYGAGKAAVIQFTKYCAAHLAEYNIRVNSISPGPFPHEITQDNKGFMEKLGRKTMLGRIGKPEEIVGATVLLASNASSYMTGTNIVVDGGWTAW